uniref:Transmembrane protein n=1 Tax=Fagus sylvatica TaxID=28930 RepID=A0A2N9FWQ3_FAGSY
MAFSNPKAFKMFAMAIVLVVMSSEMVGAITHDGTASFKLGRRALGVSKPNDSSGGYPKLPDPYPTTGSGGYSQPIGHSPP